MPGILDSLIAALAGGSQGVSQALAAQQTRHQRDFENQLQMAQFDRQMKLYDAQLANTQADNVRADQAQKDLQDRTKSAQLETAYKSFLPTIPDQPGLPGRPGQEIPSELAPAFKALNLPTVGGGPPSPARSLPSAPVNLPGPASLTPSPDDVGPQLPSPQVAPTLPGRAALSPLVPLSRPAGQDDIDKYIGTQKTASDLQTASMNTTARLRADAALARAGGNFKQISDGSEIRDIVTAYPHLVDQFKPKVEKPPLIHEGSQGGKNALYSIDPESAQAKPIMGVNGQPIGGTIPSPILMQNQAAAAVNAPGEVPLSKRPSPEEGAQIHPATGLTKDALFNDGMVWATTGKIPQVGLGTNPRAWAVRTGVQNTGSAIAREAGVDIPTLQAEYKAYSGTLSKLKPMYEATTVASNTAKDNLALADASSAEVARSGSRFANKMGLWLQGGLTPATGLTQFETYVYTAAREYAKVVGGSSASVQGLTDLATTKASELLNTSMSPEAFHAAVTAMQNDMGNVVKNQTASLAKMTSPTVARFLAAANGVDLSGGNGFGAGGSQSTQPGPRKPVNAQDYLNGLTGGR